MTVTEISAGADRRGRHRVCLSDGTVFKLPPAVIAGCGLFTGRELDVQALEQLLAAGKKAEAKQRAMNIISATSVSERDLADRLRRKGASEEDADETTRWLTELNLLDDAKTARQIVERGVRRGYGQRRIRQMLFEKKIPRDLWDDALAELPPPDGAIDDYIRAKLRDKSDHKEIKRTADALLRRGFEWNDIKRGLRRYDEADAMEEE